MKANLKTIRKALNDYLNPDPATGLIPMTPMHLELNHFEAELRETLARIRSVPRTAPFILEDAILGILGE